MSNCSLWFGTEQRSLWFPTPLSGADMSPAGWETEDTYLNGGAFVRHSWGTHKKYVFEWKGTSARTVAQMMKSYRDGSYGRGLIYFVDPLIYDLNVLPARWADPSMAIDYEGASHVLGVEPEAVPTSGGASLGLPVTSAYYNLTDIETDYRGDQESVFIPIPEGYSLVLGAIYTAVGSAGVFVNPVDANGTLGPHVKLTALPNSSSNVVVDSFKGGQGVRLWIGKEFVGFASITIAGIVGRLVANKEAVVRTNLYHDPRVTQAVTTWEKTGGNYGTITTGTDPSWGAFARWSYGTFMSAGADGAILQDRGNYPLPVVAGRAYTVSFDVRSSLSWNLAARIQWKNQTFSDTTHVTGPGVFTNPNTPTRVSVTAVAPHSGFLQVQVGSETGFNSGSEEKTLDFSKILVEQAPRTLPYFSGSDPLAGGVAQWLGTANNSESQWTSTFPATLTSGPWVGGMGHSGCRFAGPPTYIANSGVNGGQIGFAASFTEVGDFQ